MGKSLSLLVGMLSVTGVAFAAIPQDLQWAKVITPRVGDLVSVMTPQGIQTYRVVERYSGQVTTQVDMPGTDTPDGVFWTGTQNITNIDFEPGAGSYNGQSIELDGLESQFTGPHYSGSMVLAVGPDHQAEARTVVNGSGDSAAAGPVNASGTLVYKNVGVDAGLDRFHVALTVGSTATLTSITNNWQSAQVPQLNGQNVATRCAVTPTAVDVATGVIQRSFTGIIMGRVNRPQPQPQPAATGALLLGLGLVGAVFAARQRS